MTFKSGSAQLIVYRSQFAGTTGHRRQLPGRRGDRQDRPRAGGLRVVFEHYDLPGLNRTGDLHVADDFKTAWFKDPDGKSSA